MINFDINDKFSFMKMEIVEALRRVIDPELQINIIDLGLVYAIKIDEVERKIVIEMTLSSPYCPMGESIFAAVKNSLEHNFTDFKADVQLVWDPIWSYDKISDEGKKLLSGG
jgi:metal-sulfur cluster biosynthetic enzyme